MVELFTEAINTPGCIPNVQGAWDTFVNTKCSEAKQTALLTYDDLLTSQLSYALPCDSDKLCASHDAALDVSEKQFLAEIGGFSANTVERHAEELKVCLANWYDVSLNGMLCTEIAINNNHSFFKSSRVQSIQISHGVCTPENQFERFSKINFSL